MAVKKTIKKKSAPRKSVRTIPALAPAVGTLPDKTAERFVAEVERGIPAEKLRRRGRPSIGTDASSTYSVRLPDELVALVDERSAMDGLSRGETVRRALIEYLTK